MSSLAALSLAIRQTHLAHHQPASTQLLNCQTPSGGLASTRRLFLHCTRRSRRAARHLRRAPVEGLAHVAPCSQSAVSWQRRRSRSRRSTNLFGRWSKVQIGDSPCARPSRRVLRRLRPSSLARLVAYEHTLSALNALSERPRQAGRCHRAATDAHTEMNRPHFVEDCLMRIKFESRTR